jgi:hypothetical protein
MMQPTETGPASNCATLDVVVAGRWSRHDEPTTEPLIAALPEIVPGELI